LTVVPWCIENNQPSKKLLPSVLHMSGNPRTLNKIIAHHALSMSGNNCSWVGNFQYTVGPQSICLYYNLPANQSECYI